MPQSRSRRITIAVLSVLTILLLGLAVFIAVRLQQTPDTPVAGTCIFPASRCCSGGTGCFCGASFDAINEGVCNPDTGAVSCSCSPKSSSSSSSSSGGGSSSSSSSSGGGLVCVPNKNAGDVCNPSCGENACDGSGPLGCNTCPNGSTRCTLNPASNPDAYNSACGTGTTPTTCCGSGSQSNSICFGEGVGSTVNSGGIDYKCNFVSNFGGICAVCSATPVGGSSSSGGGSSSGGSSSSSSGGSGTCTPNYFTSGSNGQIANVSIPDTAACDGQTFTFVKFTGPANSGTCSENQVGGTGTTYPLTRGQSQSQEAGCGQCAQIDGTNGTTGGIRANNTSCTGSSSSSSSSSSGTSSSGGGAYTCNAMTRIPTGSPLPPGQTVSVQVTETSSTANNAACVFLVDGSNAQVAQSTRTGGPTAGPNNTWTHNYNIAIPGGAANGNYSLRYSRSCAMGALEAAAACQQAFTVTAGVQENPALSLIKSSAVVTLPNGNANINYTITITNSGNVAATISPVVDVLPVQVTSASQVTATNPQASQITADAITWNGPFTVNPNSSIQFTYTLSFTAAEIAAFTSNQLINTVTITNTGTGGGTLSFTLLTLLGALPATGLFDEPAGLMVVGLILIMIGLIINRSGILLNLFGAGVGSTDATTKLVESFLRGETEENRKDKFAAKVVSQQEKKYRK